MVRSNLKPRLLLKLKHNNDKVKHSVEYVRQLREGSGQDERFDSKGYWFDN